MGACGDAIGIAMRDALRYFEGVTHVAAHGFDGLAVLGDALVGRE